MISIKTVFLTQLKDGLPIQMGLLTPSQRKLVSGTIRTQMATVIISNTLMAKLGDLHSVAIVVRPQLVTQHLTAGGVRMLMVMGGQIQRLIGWRVQGERVTHGRLTQLSGMTEMATGAGTIPKEPLLTSVRIVQELQ